MSEWPLRRLGDVTTQALDAVKIAPGEEYRLLGVKWYAEGPFHRETVTSETTKATRFFKVRRGQFIYNRLFAWKGSFGLVGEELDGSFVSNEFPLFDCDPKQLLPEFLNLHFRQSNVWSYVEQVSTGTTASRSRWKESQFRLYEIALPSLAEQRRIVDAMAAMDAQIEVLAGEERALADAYIAFLADFASSHPHVPVESVVASGKAGGTPSRDRADFFGGTIPWLKSGEVENDAIETASEFITEAGLKGSSARLVEPGATVVAMYGQGDTKGRAGFIAAPVTTNQAVLALRPEETKIHPRLLLHAIRSQTAALRARAIGAAQPNLSKGLVMSHEIPVPEDLAVQAVIAGAADSIVAERTRMTDELARLRMFRSTLMTALLNQEIDIPESYDSLLEVSA